MADIRPAVDPREVLAAGGLFDLEPTLGRATGFLRGEGNHLLLAYVDEAAVGFVSGVEVSHPDKPTEMMLYELGVAEGYRRLGIGTALVEALADKAREVGCAAMWAPTDAGNAAATATYRATGAVVEDAAIATWEL